MGRPPKYGPVAQTPAERQRRRRAQLRDTEQAVTKPQPVARNGMGRVRCDNVPSTDRGKRAALDAVTKQPPPVTKPAVWDHDAEIEFQLAVEEYAQRRFAEQMAAAQRLRRGAGMFSRAEWGTLLKALDGARPYDPEIQRAAYDLVWARKELLYLDKDEPADTGMPKTLREMLERGIKAAQQRRQQARERAARRKAASL